MVLLVVPKCAHRRLLLADRIVLTAVDLAVLVGGAWHGGSRARCHVWSGDELLGKNEGVRADTKRLEVLAGISHYMSSMARLMAGLPRNNALLLVLHAFLDCSRLSLPIFDDCLVDGCHFWLRRQTSSRNAVGANIVMVYCSIGLRLVLLIESVACCWVLVIEA